MHYARGWVLRAVHFDGTVVDYYPVVVDGVPERAANGLCYRASRGWHVIVIPGGLDVFGGDINSHFAPLPE